MKHMKSALLMLTFCTAVFVACKKDNDSTTNLKVRMTDSPADWDEVNIDLKQVNVKFSDDSSSNDGWVSLDTKPGMYNLLDFQNGVDTLIAQGQVSTDVVKEIRLVLGSGNTIKVNGQTYPLTVPSGETSGLKIKVDRKLAANLDSLLIDFDALLSVKEENGAYKLRPVIRLK
ncbi:MAG TPA: DUF4382 domain-containing protein [Flavisolibacter sp.]|jgi:hypothetical protein|nr:DUF4382 domain-containing protein [Flavisolibacter sp.]